MKGKLMKKMVVVAGLLLAALILVPTESQAASKIADIPVQVESGKNSTEQYTIVIEPENASYPMPDNGNTLSIEGSGSNSFQIRFDQVGTYQYLISQQKGTRSRTVYSDAVYRVIVYVTSSSNGTELSAVVYDESTGLKKDDIFFRNRARSSGGGGGGNSGTVTPGKDPDKDADPKQPDLEDNRDPGDNTDNKTDNKTDNDGKNPSDSKTDTDTKQDGKTSTTSDANTAKATQTNSSGSSYVPSTSTSRNSTATGSTARTGDERPVVPYLFLMFISFSLMIALSMENRRHQKRN